MIDFLKFLLDLWIKFADKEAYNEIHENVIHLENFYAYVSTTLSVE